MEMMDSTQKLIVEKARNANRYLEPWWFRRLMGIPGHIKRYNNDPADILDIHHFITYHGLHYIAWGDDEEELVVTNPHLDKAIDNFLTELT